MLFRSGRSNSQIEGFLPGGKRSRKFFFDTEEPERSDAGSCGHFSATIVASVIYDDDLCIARNTFGFGEKCCETRAHSFTVIVHRDHNGVSRTRCFHAVCLTDVE